MVTCSIFMPATNEPRDSNTPHAPSTPIDTVPNGKTKGEEKANRNTPPFKNRCNSMKTKENIFSNRNKKCRFLLPYLQLHRDGLLAVALEVPAGGVAEVGEDGMDAGNALGLGEGKFGAAVFVGNLVGALDLNGVEGTARGACRRSGTGGGRICGASGAGIYSVPGPRKPIFYGRVISGVENRD